MKLLFIDTHSEKMTIMIKNEEKLTKVEPSNSKNHSEIALSSIEETLSKAELSIQEIDSVIVVNGPGSFTGVRIGVTIAKTLAYSLDIPIKTITSLEMYGVSSKEGFDIVTVEDSKGVYSAKKTGDTYAEFLYQRRDEFDNYIEKKNYKILDKKNIDLDLIIEYLKDVDPINAHSVKPIYIKEIDALK